MTCEVCHGPLRRRRERNWLVRFCSKRCAGLGGVFNQSRTAQGQFTPSAVVVPIRSCETCGTAFQRTRNASDNARFCSRLCAFRARTAAAAARAAQVQQARHEARQHRAIEREFARLVRGELRRALAFPRPRPPSRPPVFLEHVCPNCGQRYMGQERRVYCSPQCSQQYLHHGNYPPLGAVPLVERNSLATLVALTRAANRHLNTASGQ